jgi:CubicO group peptidase (beta-lactamase class C family)
MTTRVAGLRRYRRLALLTVLLVLLGVVPVLTSGLYPVRLLRTDVHCGRTASGDVNGQLQCLVSEYIGQDPSVRNIELAVAKGDGSYSWAGSAGAAQQHDGTPMAAETPIYLASVTKIYIATLVMLLSQDKLLSLDDPAARYLPASLIDGIDIYGGHDYSREVTVRQLVSMTSGIPDYYEEKGTDGKTMLDLFIEDPARTWTPGEMINRARTDLTPHFPPGKGLYYSDTNYQLLGKIIENVTRTSLSSALQNYLFRPLGLRHTWLTGSPEPAGLAAPAHVFDHQQDITAVRAKDYWADGGLVATPADMIAFLRALNDGKIISPASLRTMQTWHDRDGSPTLRPIPGAQYGYGLWHFQMTGPLGALKNVVPTWGATGSTGSFLYYSQDLDLYIAGTVDSASSDMTPFFLMVGAMSLVSGNDHSSHGA